MYVCMYVCIVKRAVFKAPAVIMNGANPGINRVSIQEYTNAITEAVIE